MARRLALVWASCHVAYVSWRLGLNAVVGEMCGGAAEEAADAAAGSDDDPIVLDGRLTTRRQVAEQYPRACRRADAERAGSIGESAARRLAGTGYLLLGLVMAAFAAAAGLHPGIGGSGVPELGLVLAVVLVSGLAVGVQGALAAQLGSALHLRSHRPPRARPEPPTVRAAVLVSAAGLVVISTFVAGALVHWVRLGGLAAGPGEWGAASGLTLGAAAFASPWLIVAGMVHGPSPARRRQVAMSRLLCAAEIDRRLAERRRARSLGWLAAVHADALRVHGAATYRARAAGREWRHDCWDLPLQRLARAHDRALSPRRDPEGRSSDLPG